MTVYSTGTQLTCSLLSSRMMPTWQVGEGRGAGLHGKFWAGPGSCEGGIHHLCPHFTVWKSVT